MLALVDSGGRKQRFFVVDFHHHIGQDESGYENFPIAANGTYAMCAKLQSELMARLESEPCRYAYAPDGRPFVKFHPVMDRMARHNQRISVTYKFAENIIYDQIVVFPAYEAIRLESETEYEKCNSQIQKWSELFPHSLRLIGFGRLNPKQYPDCLAELEKMVTEKGLRGLKLHPKSEFFDMNSEPMKGLLKACAGHDIPVIFHTSYGHEVKALADLASEIVVELLNEGREDDVPGLKLVAGHCTYETDDVFRALEHPCVFGELSLLSSPQRYLKLASKKIRPVKWVDHGISEIMERHPNTSLRELMGAFVSLAEGKTWSHKLLFGSDHPFSPYSKTMEVMLALMEKDSPAEPEDIANILGGNAASLIRPKFYAGIKGGVSFEKIKVDRFIQHALSDRKRIFLEPVISEGRIDPKRAVVTNAAKAGKAYSVLVNIGAGEKQLDGISGVSGLADATGKPARTLIDKT